ncbi:ABC transporter permease [Clostridium formicaceticum]|uniref:ABC transporter permease n=1 Tax=Clostridium formicaceticum TaxID=1497 RepID=A0AAC9RPJ1_9CLOT|nr:ABC transporter permease [Clostridium formicaceticum]AOY78010.1 ABC transporter permease [Clostridium formicaceticum]ARE88643.1 Branched-chain amino acid transport system / permease component [Clostridium formicaceticum]
MTLFIGSIQLGLIYAIMALGIYITFRILNVPDLTVDGSFSLGMACAAVITIAGYPFLALLFAMIAGALAGLTTGLLQTKLSIHPILSGILVMTGLYTVNLGIMGGRANLSLVGSETLFMKMESMIVSQSGLGRTLLALLVCIVIIGFLAIVFKTRFGLAIRATGDNEEMVRSSSINANTSKCIGLSMGNACVALSGALICQYQMFSDVGSGSGMVVIGLASVIIGEALFGRRSVTFGLISSAVGSIIYRIIVAFALKIDLFPPYALKLVSATIVAIALSVPSIKANIEQNKKRREAANRLN